MAFPGQQEKRGGAQLMRHAKNPVSVFQTGTAPETANERPGRNQLFPILQRQLPAEKHEAHQQIMLFRRKKRLLRGKSGKHAHPKVFNGMQGENVVFPVFPRKKRHLIERFGVRIRTVSVKKASERKGCKILLAGFKLIGPQDTRVTLASVPEDSVTWDASDPITAIADGVHSLGYDLSEEEAEEIRE